jgi:hypothetical protein
MPTEIFKCLPPAGTEEQSLESNFSYRKRLEQILNVCWLRSTLRAAQTLPRLDVRKESYGYCPAVPRTSVRKILKSRQHAAATALV